jgi:peptide/nickel transport system permease protein
MVAYIRNRVIALIPVLAVVAVTIFLLAHLSPGDPAAVLAGEGASAEQVEQIRTSLGLDRPLWEQFGLWIYGLFRGDLGQSIFLQQPVTEAILNAMAPTLYLTIYALLLSMLIAIPAGTWAARRAGTGADTAFLGATMIGISVPSFLVALVLILVFAVGLGWLPAGGYVPPERGFLPFISSLTLPAIALAIQASFMARITRESVIESLRANYVKTAFAKGVSERRILSKHALKNAAVPILTVIGGTVGDLLTGAIFVETVFNIPGMGSLTIDSISRRDFAVIQGTVLTTAVIYVFVNLVVDMLYGVIDPRTRVRS